MSEENSLLQYTESVDEYDTGSSFGEAVEDFSSLHLLIASLIRGAFSLAVEDILYRDIACASGLDQLFFKNDALFKSILLMRWPLDWRKKHISADGEHTEHGVLTEPTRGQKNTAEEGNSFPSRHSGSENTAVFLFIPPIVRRLVHLLGLRTCLRVTLQKSSNAMEKGFKRKRARSDAAEKFVLPESIVDSLSEYADELEKEKSVSFLLRSWSSDALRSLLATRKENAPNREECSSSKTSGAPSEQKAVALEVPVELAVEEDDQPFAEQVIHLLGKIWMAYVLYAWGSDSTKSSEEASQGARQSAVCSDSARCESAYNMIHSEIAPAIRTGLRRRIRVDATSHRTSPSPETPRSTGYRRRVMQDDPLDDSLSMIYKELQGDHHRSSKNREMISDISVDLSHLVEGDEGWRRRSHPPEVMIGENNSRLETHSLKPQESYSPPPRRHKQGSLRNYHNIAHTNTRRSTDRPSPHSENKDNVMDEGQREEEFQEWCNPARRRSTTPLFADIVFREAASVDITPARSRGTSTDERPSSASRGSVSTGAFSSDVHTRILKNDSAPTENTSVRYYTLQSSTKRYEQVKGNKK